MEEQEDVFYFQGAFTKPRISALVKLLCYTGLELAALILPSCFLTTWLQKLLADERIFRYLIKAEKVVI